MPHWKVGWAGHDVQVMGGGGARVVEGEVVGGGVVGVVVVRGEVVWVVAVDVVPGADVLAEEQPAATRATRSATTADRRGRMGRDGTSAPRWIAGRRLPVLRSAPGAPDGLR